METIGDKIKGLRKSKGLSLMDLANILSVSDTSLSKIETGKTKNVTVEFGKSLAKALNISFVDLFEIEVKANKESEILVSEIEDLKKKIEEKTLLIDLLLREQEIFKRTSVQAIVSYSDNIISRIDEELKIAKTDNERAYLEAQKRSQIVTKQHMIDNFLHIGFFNQSDIDSYYKELREHYEALGKIWKQNYDNGEYSYLVNPETGELTAKE